jgi:TPR repeat protein
MKTRIILLIFISLLSLDVLSKNISPYIDKKVEEYNSGNAESAFKIGQAYQLGLSVPKSMDEAIEWYKRSDLLEFPKAASMLGMIYFDKEDYRTSIFYLKKGINYEEGLSYAYLGKIFKFNGSEKKAFQMFKKSAELGNPVGQYLLADSFEKGFVSDRNIPLALNWFKKSAEKNYLDAKKRYRELKKTIK